MEAEKEAALARIAKEHGVDLMYLFGSQVANGLKILRGMKVEVLDPLTDLDVGVVTSSPLPPPAGRSRLYADLYIALSDVFEPFPLDLVFLEENHSVFQSEVFKGQCVYASSEQVREDYEMNILRRAADFKPFLEKYLREALEGQRMSVNSILVQQRLLLLREYTLRMSELARSDEDEFCQNTTVSAAAESYLRRALEVVFDIGRHILAKTGYTELSMEYKSIARGLAEQGIVPGELGEKLTRMAGYRNRLVHLYHQVTVEELYRIITENLNDFRAFSDSIQKLVP